MAPASWENWARTQRVTPRRVERPADTAEVAGAVRRAVDDGLRVRAVGSGHSFTGAAVADGVQLDLRALDRVERVARQPDGGALVTVGAGIRLSVLTSDGRELSFAHVEPPSIFGELAIFDGRPRSADATAVNKVETLLFSKAAFLRLLASHPSVGEAAVRFLASRLRDADEQLEAIARHPIEARLARFFLASVRQEDPSDKAEKISLALPISQSELALLVGASRPKVNAALQLLESEGAIERRGQQVICDIIALSGIGRLDDKD